MKKGISIFFIFILIVFSCKKNRFKVKTFIPELYELKIAPELEEVESKTSALLKAWEAYASGQITVEGLNDIRATYKTYLVDTYGILSYDIGDISKTYVYGRFYKSTIDTAKIWTKYSEQASFLTENVLSMVNNVKGITTVEFLLFNENSTDSILNSQKYRRFLEAHIDAISIEMTNIKKSWAIYQNNFEQMLDEGVDGSYNMVVNKLIHQLEDISIKKIGTPLVDSETFAKLRIDLMKQIIKSQYRIFMGEGTTTFNSIFNHIRKKDKQLANSIQTDFESLMTLGDGLDQTFDYYLTENPEVLIDYRSQVENLIRVFKTEVLSKIGVTLTIGDSDGD